MPSDPVLEFSALVAPIPGEDPAGKATHYLTFRDEWKKLSAVKNLNNTTNPSRPEDWIEGVELAKTALVEHSKDIRIVGKLVEALTRAHRFAGLRDGLELLRRLCEDGWDRLIPALETSPEGKPDAKDRVDCLSDCFDDEKSGTRFPVVVRMVPLVQGRGQPELSETNWSQAGKPGYPAKEDLERVAHSIPRVEVVGFNEELQACRAVREALVQVLSEKVEGSVAPGFGSLKESLDDWDRLIHHFLGLTEDISSEPNEPPATPASTPSASSRAEAYRQLKQTASTLRKLEPHSPVPLLIEHLASLEHEEFPKLTKINECVIPLLKALGVDTEPKS